MEASETADAHRWTMRHWNKDAWAMALDAVAGATRTIDVEHYIIANHGIGQTLLYALEERARAGVRVRVMADGYGSFALAESKAGRALRKAGGQVVAYNRLRALVMHPLTHTRRLHRKTILIDGQRLLVGGTCFADRMVDWRDTMLSIEGPVAKHAAQEFELGWKGTTLQVRERPERAAGIVPPLPEIWSYLVCGPRPMVQRQFRDGLLAAIKGAQRRVDLTTPYLVPDRPFAAALADAVDRGVRVRILIPARADHFFVHQWTRWHARALAREGVEVVPFTPAMMHSKIALIDDDWASVGSFNIDLLSIVFNLENGVVSRDPAFRAELENQLEADFAHTHR